MKGCVVFKSEKGRLSFGSGESEGLKEGQEMEGIGRI
jgi:hypothetical protein|tara:strand:- start:130 stop:240 length:111 start_codon:yes stop_codon:yes gene_type:complete